MRLGPRRRACGESRASAHQTAIPSLPVNVPVARSSLRRSAVSGGPQSTGGRMTEQGMTGTVERPGLEDAPRPYLTPRFPTERSDDELAACARPLAWDETGFPLPKRQRSLAGRFFHLFER